jgi:hypothetical protein
MLGRDNAAGNRAHVAILRRKHFDEDAQVEVLSVWGYRAECPCGWKGERRQLMGTARRELRTHLEFWHNTR